MPTNDTENIYSTEFENDPNPIPSSKVGYDNTESGLEATTVQGAIDELDSKIKASDEASEITYDNTESGLDAENVQDAIDEIAGDIPDLEGYTVKTIETVLLPNCTTYPSLVENIKSDMEAVISAQPDNERLVILGLSIDGFGFFSYYGSRALWAKNTATTYLSTMFTRVRNDASTVVIETMSGTGCKRATIGDSSFVAKDFVVDEPTNTIVTRVQVLRLKSV